MRILRALDDALSASRWDEVSHLLDLGFFRMMILAPDAIDRTFEAVPESWFEANPRHVMSRALHSAVRLEAPLESTAVERFTSWVRTEHSPALRDVLGIHCARIRQLTARGWSNDANRLADVVLQLLREAPARDEGLQDVAPAVFLLCGMTKLLAGELQAAAACFSEARRWSAIADQHPFGRYAAEHLALVHVLEERYDVGQSLLAGLPPEEPAAPGSLQRLHQPAGFLTRLLLATASFDSANTQSLLAQTGSVVADDDLRWVATHAATRLALVEGNPWPMVHELSTQLMNTSARNAPSSYAGATARADLASLYQAVGDLQTAERLLSAPDLFPASGTTIARARQAMLGGKVHDALRVLRESTAGSGTGTPARLTPSGAVLYASAELAAFESVTEQSLYHASTAVQHHQAWSALMHASLELRAELLPGVGIDAADVPSPWALRRRPPLTRREREVLEALKAHSTMNEVAAALHVSTNTAKTHVKSLYRKLGAHKRVEALRLGEDW